MWRIDIVSIHMSADSIIHCNFPFDPRWRLVTRLCRMLATRTRRMVWQSQSQAVIQVSQQSLAFCATLTCVGHVSVQIEDLSRPLTEPITAVFYSEVQRWPCINWKSSAQYSRGFDVH
jgi:hypothetical protein